MADDKQEAIDESLPTVFSSDDMDYSSYLMVDQLLGLQRPQSDPPHHDEMLFIIIHQAYELWFKLVLHELERAMNFMASGNLLRGRHFVDRVVRVMKLMVHQIHLLETMTPAEFLAFRDHLKPASGFQSVQFREIEFVAGLKDERYLRWFDSRPALQQRLRRRLDGPDLHRTMYAMLAGLGFDIPSEPEDPPSVRSVRALLPVYEDPAANMPLYLLLESLVDLDQTIALWRQHHVQVVERIIGAKRGTGGSSGVEYLRKTTSKRLFPLLWDLRSALGTDEPLEATS